MEITGLLAAEFVFVVTELGGFVGAEAVVAVPLVPEEVVALVKSVASPNPAAIGFCDSIPEVIVPTESLSRCAS